MSSQFPRLALIAIVATVLAALVYGRSVKVEVNEQGDFEPPKGSTMTPMDYCESALQRLELGEEETSVLDTVSFVVHRNGEPDPCGMAPSSVESLEKAVKALKTCDKDGLNKYQVESLLTQLFSENLAPGSCGSTDDDEAPEGLLGYCDMGPDRTPILMDHQQLVLVPSSESLPCRFFTREGVRISSLEKLKELALNSKVAQEECRESGEETCSAGDTVHLYAVPAGRMFMFAAGYVGEIFNLTHVTGREGQPISIEVLNLEPRVFDIYNFFSREEADELIAKAVAETSETHKLHRSTTGQKGSIYNMRTSENAWDTHGTTAQRIKKRCLTTLGFDEYIEGHTDGLQILRYNTTTAYIPHMDYLDDRNVDSYNYDSAGKGGNRYATILLYMTDLDERDGGQTVFVKAPPPGVDEKDQLSESEAVLKLREAGDAKLLEAGSWEEKMAATCRTRLSVTPKHHRAVLFYSQHPNGEEDFSSRHGGCPVLNPDVSKWAANLWVFSAPRLGYSGAPLKEGQTDDTGYKQIKAQFHNTGADPVFDNAELFYDESGDFGKLPPGETISVNTYKGHKWNIMVSGKALKTIIIDQDEEHQQFSI